MLIAPPIDLPSIRAAIIAAAAQGTGLDPGSIMVNNPPIPNSPRPAKPYMAYQFTTASGMAGWDATQITEDGQGNTTQVTYGQRMIMASFNTYADDQDTAWGIMAQWQAALNGFPNVYETLQAAGVAIFDIGDVRDLSLLLETAYEGRAQMDVTFGAVSVATYANPDIITSATVRTSFTPPDTVTVTLGD